MSKFKLLHDLIMIKKTPARTKTDSGIHVVDNVGIKGAPIEGVVVAVGPGKYTPKGDFVKVDVEPGDQVIFAQNNLNEIRQIGDGFVIVPTSEILLRLRPDNPVIPEPPEV